MLMSSVCIGACTAARCGGTEVVEAVRSPSSPSRPARVAPAAAVQRPVLTAQGWRAWGSPRWRRRMCSRAKWFYISYTLGLDGHWQSPSGFHLIVEVKTSETYAIKTATLTGYVDTLISAVRG